MDHLLHDDELPKHERELTLSTGSILALFLGLVVLCGGFFGFGYNMGRKSAPTPLSLSDVNPEPTVPTVATSSVKPAAGSLLLDTPSPVPATPAPKPVRRVAPAASALGDDASPTVVAPTTAAPRTTPPAGSTTLSVPKTSLASQPPAPIVRQPAPVPVPVSALSGTAAPASGSYMVQVAAVSHQEDAELLVGALRARGYAVSARSTGGDKFIHVQVGPFRDKKEADAMRQRLLTDGYNAIVK